MSSRLWLVYTTAFGTMRPVHRRSITCITTTHTTHAGPALASWPNLQNIVHSKLWSLCTSTSAEFVRDAGSYESMAGSCTARGFYRELAMDVFGRLMVFAAL